jgi:hypothetical protein
MTPAVYDLTLQTMLLQAASPLLIAALNGSTIRLCALAFGVAGPAQDGRRTLNPFPHVDILGGLALIVFGLGWSRPVALARVATSSRLWTTVAIIVAGRWPSQFLRYSPACCCRSSPFRCRGLVVDATVVGARSHVSAGP